MEAGSKDRPPMLAPGNYVQWKSKIKRYIDTKPNHELIHYCLKNPLYELGWKDKLVLDSDGNLTTTTERVLETYKNVTQDIRDQLNAEAEAVQIILTGIDNDIYSIVDACPNACEMWKAIERMVNHWNRITQERSRMSHINVNNEKKKESFKKQTTFLEKRMDKSIPLVKNCQRSLEIVKVKTNINTIITGVELCKQKIANRTYIGYIDPFIKNMFEQNFCPVISRINVGIDLFLKSLNKEMVADLRYFNSLELEVDSLTSQLETQRTQFLNEIDRLSREYYYANHMHAILGVYTELDEVTNLQGDYLELLQKCKCLEIELSKSKMMSKSFESVQQHAINLKLELQQYLKAQLQDKGIAINELKKLIEKLKGKSVDTKFEKSSVIRQLNAKSQRPSILGKPTTFSNSFFRKDFSKSTSVTQTHVSNDFSKPVTAQTLPVNKKSIVQNTNVFHCVKYSIVLFIVDSGCSKYMTGNLKLLINFVEKFLGTFSDADLEVAFRKSTCFIHDLKENDLLTGSCGTDLYSITLQDTNSPNLICLMAKATSSQAWLWHRRLSHLNFNTINLLSKNDIVVGLPKLKFIKDHLCSSFIAENQTNSHAGLQDIEKAGEEVAHTYGLFPVLPDGFINSHNKKKDALVDGKEHDNDIQKCVSPDIYFSSSGAQTRKQGDKTENKDKGKSPVVTITGFRDLNAEFEECTNNSTANSSDMPNLEDLIHSDDADNVGAEADINNLESIISTRSMARTVRDQGGISQMFNEDFHTCMFACFLSQEEPKRILVNLPYGKRAIGTKWVYRNKKDERGIVIKNKARLVAQGHTQEEGIDYEEVFALVARIEAIRLFLAYASFMGFLVYQMDVKSTFLYGTIEKEVYVCQPPGFEDPENPDKVYKVVKALYGLHQAPRAWYETLATYLLENGFERRTIDQTLFIKKQ
nr:putative ribonuclease H-like domain-containing protein [Tanacetum cinerariifolium]